MNGLIIAAIVVGTICAYLPAGFYTGRAWARYAYKKAYYDKKFAATMAFATGGIFWPVASLVIVAIKMWMRRSYGLMETIIPELRQKADEKRQRGLEQELLDSEHEIARLHRELGIKP